MKQLLAVLAGLALAGCEAPPAAPATTTQSAPKAADPHEEKAPLVLSLTAVSDENGVLELLANIDATAALPIPVELTISLPPDAKLVGGDERQSVAVAAGRTGRTFRVAHSKDLAPIKVTAHAVHPKGAWGLHAEKLYPELPKTTSFTPGKAPPMARPPAPTLPAVHPKEAP